MLGPTADVMTEDALGHQDAFDGLDHIIDVTITIDTLFSQLPGDGLVIRLLQITKGEIFKLPLDLTDAQPVRQWRVDIKYFPCHLLLLFPRGVLDLTQGTGALGNLDQCDADVIDHGHQHLAQIVLLVMLGQPRAWRLQITDSGHLQDAINQLRHFSPKPPAYRLAADQSFAHGPIEYRRLQRRLIKLQQRKDIRHFQAHAITGILRQPHFMWPLRLQ